MFTLSFLSGSLPTCGDIKSLYQDSECCGKVGTTPIPCHATSAASDPINAESLPFGRNTEGDHFLSSPMLRDLASRGETSYSLAKSVGLGTVPGDGEFWKNLAIDATHLYYTSRDGELLKIRRSTLAVEQRLDVSGATGIKTREAPVLVGNDLYLANEGFFAPWGIVKFPNKNLSTPVSFTSSRHAAEPGVFSFQNQVGVAHMPACNDGAGGPGMLIGESSFSYAAYYDILEVRRAFNLPGNKDFRGRLDCVCLDGGSEQHCGWSQMYKPPASLGEGTVAANMLNTARSSFIGALDVLNSTQLAAPVAASRLIPKHFTATVAVTNLTADGRNNTVVGDVLTQEGGVKLKILSVDGQLCTLRYLGAYWNTPTAGAWQYVSGGTVDASASVSVTFQSMTLDVAYTESVNAMMKDAAFAVNGIVEPTVAVADITYPFASFDDLIDLGSGEVADQALISLVQHTEASFRYPAGYRRETRSGTATRVVDGVYYGDHSGVTMKRKLQLGEPISAAARESVYTSGGGLWTPCTDTTEHIYCPIGNGHMMGFDYYHITRDSRQAMLALSDAQESAIARGDAGALKDSMTTDALQALFETEQTLMAEIDRDFFASGFIKLKKSDGTLEYGKHLAGHDFWVSTAANFDPLFNLFSEYTIPKSFQEALAFDYWKDTDTNFLAVQDGKVYVGTKGGWLAVFDDASRDMLSSHKVAMGRAAGGSAPGNYASTCLRPDGVMITFGTTHIESKKSAALDGTNTTWVAQDGQKFTRVDGHLVAWDSKADTELWSRRLRVFEGEAALSIDCIGPDLIAVCPHTKDARRRCVYDARSGVVKQLLTADGATGSSQGVGLARFSSTMADTSYYVVDGDVIREFSIGI